MSNHGPTQTFDSAGGAVTQGFYKHSRAPPPGWVGHFFLSCSAEVAGITGVRESDFISRLSGLRKEDRR